MLVAEQRTEINLTIRVPEELGRKLKEQPDPNDFMVKAVHAALEDQIIAQRLARSQEQSERGEDATEEVEAFFSKWDDNAG